MTETGYYWAYRKGSPVPDIVYVWKEHAYEVFVYEGNLELGAEALSEQKWILGEKIVPPGVDNLP